SGCIYPILPMSADLGGGKNTAGGSGTQGKDSGS
ncbi:unnamed protein product, partial [marine sediment metagenome]